MAGADNMENTTAGDLETSTADNLENKWFGCDFCAAESELHCLGDVWLCTLCRQRLEDEIASVEALMEEE